MVARRSDDAEIFDGIVSAVANSTRRTLLEALLEGEATVSALVQRTEVSQPAVSQQLAILKEAGLVSERAAGRFRYYRLNAAPLEQLLAWTQQYRRFWETRLDALGATLDAVEDTAAEKDARRRLHKTRRDR